MINNHTTLIIKKEQKIQVEKTHNCKGDMVAPFHQPSPRLQQPSNKLATSSINNPPITHTLAKQIKKIYNPMI